MKGAWLLSVAPALLLALWLLVCAPSLSSRRDHPASLAPPEPRTSSYPYHPTPLHLVRHAASSYFPQMFDGQQALPPGEFKKIARNPCWYSQATYCLPAFLLIGVYQSGIQDLYRRLVQHEDIARRPARSPSYYSQVRPDWSDYVRGIQDCVPQAEAGKLIGEVSAVTFHFIWVHQEKFNQPYVEAMGGFWRECNARTNAQKKEVLPSDRRML